MPEFPYFPPLGSRWHQSIGGLGLSLNLSRFLATLAIGALIYIAPSLSVQAAPPSVAAVFSPLAPHPHWDKLNPYQETVTRREFTDQIHRLYAPASDAEDMFWRYATLTDRQITFFGDTAHTLPRFQLHFALSSEVKKPIPTALLPPLNSDPIHPLAPLVICLDPGHIGGDWAHMEERFFQIHGDRPILEAQLNLWACRHAAAALAAAGAKVVWTKTDEEPVTSLRPEDLKMAAYENLFSSGLGLHSLPPLFLAAKLQVEEEKLFYRTAEIQARAHRVASLKPDLTLCVHFNAAAWGDPLDPQFVPQSRIVVFVHGHYMADELVYEDERYDLIRKLLEQSAPIELAVGETISQSMEAIWKLPPEIYQDWPAVHKVGEHPYLYARNLLASRLYPGPVVFIEGPYMNADDAYPRLEAGDYEGTRLIAGHEYRSIFAEYGEAIAKGVVAYATGSRSSN